MKLFKAEIVELTEHGISISRRCSETPILPIAPPYHPVGLASNGTVNMCNSYCSAAIIDFTSELLIFTCKATDQEHMWQFKDLTEEQQKVINKLIGDENG